MAKKIILIHPPVAKCSEPPAGIARLASCLKANAIRYEIIDANLEGILYLLRRGVNSFSDADRWTRRASKNLERNLSALKNALIYKDLLRYQRAVTDVNRLLHMTGKPAKTNVSLSDYQDRKLSPLKISDLLTAAEEPQSNPFYPYFQDRLGKMREECHDYIGFSLNYLSQALCTFAMVGFLRRILPDRKIILGGSLITSWMKLGLPKNKFHGLVDHWVEGPGEETLLQIMAAEGADRSSPPDYGKFPLDDYLAPGRILPYSTAHGCYWHQCAFCPEKAEGNEYRPLEASLAAGNLLLLKEKLQPVLIHILDSSISPAMLNTLTECAPAVPWYGFARATKHLTDLDFCLSLKKSGCTMLKLGIESGDQRVLDQLNKGMDVATASAALRTLNKSGIAAYCYFLFGTPPETEESAFKTMDFVAAHHKEIAFLNLAIFNLPALSSEAQILATTDFYEGDLSLYRNFRHPRGWHRPAIRHFLEKTFKKQPAIASIIKRTPAFFTSNHAPFFVLRHSTGAV